MPAVHLRLFLGSAWAAALLLVAGCAAPQGPRVLLTDEDHVFALQALGAGQYEAVAGGLAMQRAVDPRVQAYGRMLVDHHTPSNAQLLGLLQARGVTPPAVLPSLLALRLARMEPMSGADFERQFLGTAGIVDHRRQIALFEQASRDVRDPALRAWFAAHLPTLRAHLDAARQVASASGG